MKKKVKIIDIHKDDSWYFEIKKIKKLSGTFKTDWFNRTSERKKKYPNYLSGKFTTDNGIYYNFLAVKIKELSK